MAVRDWLAWGRWALFEQREALRAPTVATLESRVLLSAAPMAEAVPEAEAASVDAEMLVRELSGQVDAKDGRRELVVYDSELPDAERLRTLIAETAAHREFLSIDSRDGLAEVTRAIEARGGDFDAIHLLTHGQDAAFAIGGHRTTADTLEADAPLWTTFGAQFSEGGDLLLYGCDIASTDAGRSLVETLSDITDLDVVASDDLTGGVAGADWLLEYASGGIEAAFVAAPNWNFTLATNTFQHNVDSYTGVVDTYIEEDTPDHQQGTLNDFTIDNRAGRIHQGLIRYDQLFASTGGPIPDGAQILSATLTFEGKGLGVEGELPNLRLHDLFVPFTSNSRGQDYPGNYIATDDVSASATGLSPSSISGKTVTFDIRDSVATWSNTGVNEGFAVMTVGTTDLELHSSDAGPEGDRPLLSIEWTFVDTLSVTTTADELDGDTSSLAALADTPGGTGISLREAITAANNTAGATTIEFDLGPGTHALVVDSAMLDIGSDVTIDGTTAAGYAGAPVITIAGDGFGGSLQSSGLRIAGNDVTVRGVAIAGFTDGVLITGANATLESNWIGVSASDTRQTTGTGSGVVLSASGATIGTPAAGNRITAFSQALDVTNPVDVTIRGNTVDQVGTGFRIAGQVQSVDRPDTDGVTNEPFITSVRRVGGNLEIDVVVVTVASSTVDIDLLDAAEAGAPTSGRYVQTHQVTTDSEGRASHTFVVADIAQTAFSAQATYDDRSSVMAIARVVPRATAFTTAARLPQSVVNGHSLNGSSRGSISAITALPDGGFYAVWTFPVLTDDVVYGRRFAADGTLSGSSVQLSGFGAEGVGVIVGADAAGRVTVAWEDPNSGDIRYRRFASDGTLGSIQTVARNGGEDLTQPSLEVLSTGEFIISATSQEDTPTSSTIVSRLYDADGTDLGGGLTTLSSSPASGVARESAIAANEHGVALVAFRLGTELRYSAKDAFNNGSVTNFNSFLTDDVKSHDIVAHSDGSFDILLLKEGAGGHDQIFAQSFTATGGLDGTLQTLSAPERGNELTNLSAAASENGDVAITFEDTATGEVLLVQVSDIGAVSTPVTVSGDATRAQTTASISFAPGTDFARVVWDGSDTDAQPQGLYSREFREASDAQDDLYNVTAGEVFRSAGEWWDASWEYRRRLTIADRAEGTLADAPVLVTLDSGTFDHGKAASGGDDLRFVASDGSLLDYEIDEWAPSGQSRIWVRLPEVRTDGSEYFDMYYGNAGAGAVSGDVWGSDHVGVYHFADGRPFADSATQGATENLSNNGSSAANGFINRGRSVGEDDTVFLNNVPFLRDVSEATVSGWFYANNSDDTGTFFGIGVDDGSDRSRLTLGFKNGSDLVVGAVAPDSESDSLQEVEGIFTRGQWVHLAAVVDYAADELTVYMNGTEVFSIAAEVAAGTTNDTNSARVDFGSGEFAAEDGFQGRFDEIRVSHVARSADWISLEHASMTGGVTTLGSEETPTGSVLDNDNGLTGPVTLSSLGSGSMSILPNGHFTYEAADGFVGVDTFRYSVDGQEAVIRLNVSAAPIEDTLEITATPTAVSSTEGVSLRFGTAETQSLRISATDTAAAMTVQLSPAGGRLTLGSTSGLTGNLGPGADDEALTLTGTVADINAALEGLLFDDSGDGTATITVDVNQTTGGGETLTATETVTIAVQNVPEPVASVDHTGGNEGEDIVFSAATSSGGLGTLTYAWTVDGTASTETGQTLTVNGSDLNNPDRVTVELTVTDERGVSDTTTYFVDVQNTPPNLPDITGIRLADRNYVIRVSDIEAVISDAADTLTVDDVTIVVGSGTIQRTGDTFRYSPGDEFESLPDGASGTVELAYHVTEETAYTGRIIVTYRGIDDPPEANDDAVTVDEDDTVSFNVMTNDSDVDGDALTAELVTLPSSGNVTLNANGDATYTPAADANGTDSFTYRVTANGEIRTATVTITINPVDDPPTAVDDLVTVNEDETANFNVLTNDSDIDGDMMTVAIVSGTANGTVSLTQDGDVEYTPDANFNGTDSFVYRLTANGQSTTATATITVNAVDDPPTATDDAVTINEDGAAHFNVVTNDFDVDGDALTVEVLSGPSNGTLDLTQAGVANYTPTANFNGLDSFVYRLTANGQSTTATATITISAVDDAPMAVDDAVTIDEDETANFNVLVNDWDVDGDALFTELVTGPTFGTVTLAANGVAIYTPSAHANGTDTFVYRVTANGESALATATITVNAIDDIPVAADDSVRINEDGTARFNVLANDSDADGDALVAQLVRGPRFGTLSLGADGETVYTPDANKNGTDTFDYRVIANGETAMATATIHVNAIDDGPVAVDDAITVDEDGVATFDVLLNDFDVDGDPLVAELVSGPSFGTVTLTGDGIAVYTPDSNANGTDSFVYRLTANGESALATAAIEVAAVDDRPVITGGPFSITEGTNGRTRLGRLNVDDPDDNTRTFELRPGDDSDAFTVNPAGQIFTVSGTTFDRETQASYRIVVRVTSGEAVVDQPVVINVTDVNERPTLGPAVFRIDENAIGLLAGMPNGSDPEGDPLTYSLRDDAGLPLSIDAATGRLTLTATLDHESYTPQTIRIGVTDGDLTAARDYEVLVLDVAEPPQSGDARFSVARRADAGMTIGVLSGTDPDGGRVRFEIVEGGDLFDIDESSGRLMLRSDTPNARAMFGEYEGRFAVTDADGASVEYAFVVDFTVEPQPPRITVPPLRVAENAADGTVVGLITASDPADLPVTVAIIGGSSAFQLDGDQLVVAGPLDHEGAGFEFVEVAATAGGRTTTANLIVRIEDVDEPVFSASDDDDLTAEVSISSDGATVDLSEVFADRVIDPESARLQFRLTNGPVAGTVSVTPEGILTYTGSGDQAEFAIIDVSDGSMEGLPVRVDLTPFVSIAPPPTTPTQPSQPQTSTPTTDAPEGTSTGDGNGPDVSDSSVTETPPAATAPERPATTDADTTSQTPTDTTPDNSPTDTDQSSSSTDDTPPDAFVQPIAQDDEPADVGDGQESGSAEANTTEAAAAAAAGAGRGIGNTLNSLAEFDNGNGRSGDDSNSVANLDRQLAFAPNRSWGQIQADFETVRLDIGAFRGATGAATLNSLDQARNDLAGGISKTATERVALTLGSSFTVGYVLWTVRGGFLLTGLLAQIPAWRVVDPLSILDEANDEAGEGESLESMLEESNSPKPGGLGAE